MARKSKNSQAPKDSTPQKDVQSIRKTVTCVVNRKGGVGKSFVCANLIPAMAALPAPLIVFDLDLTNLDSTRFCSLAGVNVAVLEHNKALDDGTTVVDREEIFEKVMDYRDKGYNVIIDCPPGAGGATDMACLLASMVIIPTRPGSNDIGGLRRVFELIEKVRRHQNPGLPVYTLCNLYRNSNEAIALVEWLEEIGSAIFLGKVWERAHYSEAMNLGKAPWEYAPESAAAIEMKGMCDYLLSQMVSLVEEDAHV